jgi:hypothetical protein
MKRITWAVLAAAGFSFAVPAYAEDPPAAGSGEELIRDQEAEAAAFGSTSAIEIEETRGGAGSMEPAGTETDEARVEREFVESIWNSP